MVWEDLFSMRYSGTKHIWKVLNENGKWELNSWVSFHRWNRYEKPAFRSWSRFVIGWSIIRPVKAVHRVARSGPNYLGRYWYTARQIETNFIYMFFWFSVKMCFVNRLC